MKQIKYQWVIGVVKWFLPFFLFTLLPLRASAQNDAKMREVYAQAENAYRVGRIEQAREVLLQNLSNFQGNLCQDALHLIALTYLVEYDIPQTEQYVARLLEQNPYYTPSSQDPATFVEIMNSIKGGMTATITTASSQAETLAEAPVPTTLITDEMIRNSGARNLQEVLAAYVPGMNLIDCNDDINIAMRGIYSNTQEKILLMLNGHRLNSYATNTAAPDFSISLEKVKQIEVLRGPASSLYGGVALTGVVNIITKQGADVDGFQAKVAAGNYGQIKADAVFGKRFFDLDMLVWGSVYGNRGEKYDVTNERTGESPYGMPVDYVRLGRIGNHPSYDFGLQLRYKGLQFMYDSHFSQVIAPFTISTLALSFDHDRYATYNGLQPSFTTYSHHADLSYSHQIGHLSLRYAATYDKIDFTRYQVINDCPMPNASLAFNLSSELDSVFNYGGISRYINGQEENYGFQLKGNYAYTLGDDHKGSIGFGAEYNHFKLDDMRYLFGYDFEETFPVESEIRKAGKGSENSGDAYVQLKHHWRSFILNAGVRYDYKRRYDDRELNELSPRVALILLRPKWNLKLSYSKSFVDAPYLYRKSNDMSMLMVGGSLEFVEGLSPERVHSFQLSFAGNKWVKGLDFEVNGFYNRASDLIMTHITEYKNAGNNKACGVELTANYKQPKLTVNFNLTWTHTFEANLMSLNLGDLVDEANNTDIDDNNNTPAIMSNLVLGWQVTPRLKLHTHLLFESRQTSYNTDLYKVVQIYEGFDRMVDCYMEGDYEGALVVEEEIAALAPYVTMRKEIPARAIINLGGEYTIGSVTIGLNIHNLLGTRYSRSGMNTNVLPQQGRWFLVSLGIRI